MRLRPLDRQVIVITGASSGIGRETARMAAVRGARLVLVGRDEATLDEVAREIAGEEGQVVAVAADVADRAAMEGVARTAIARFGRIDSWINDAGGSVYAELDRLTEEDHRRLFETNYWGVVNGSMAALPHLASTAQGKPGGALINIGSVLSDHAVPLQGAYAASKHAVKGYTNALRIEVMRAGLPVSVTLIKPTGIDTAFADHAPTYLDHAPRVPPVVYTPRIVARAILHCCQYPKRQVYVGGAGFLLVLLATHAPWLYERLAASRLDDLQTTDRPVEQESGVRGNLHEPRPGAVRSRHRDGPIRDSSLWTDLQLNAASAVPSLGLLALGTFALGAAIVLGGVGLQREPALVRGARAAHRLTHSRRRR
jgi:short-subunit dehydrogenase